MKELKSFKGLRQVYNLLFLYNNTLLKEFEYLINSFHNQNEIADFLNLGKTQ